MKSFRQLLCGLAILFLLASVPCHADENGVGVWLPGFYGSLAAAPGKPGFSFTSLYYHSSLHAGKGVEMRRGSTFHSGIDAKVDIIAFVPGYTFETPVLGGQASIALMALGMRNKISAAAELTGPRGRSFSREVSDSITSVGDLYPMGTLKWNFGVHNAMVYAAGSLPVGNYSQDRLANVGTGHGAIDGGAGYTYFNPSTGWEFSSVLGFTYNFENNHTDYQNGIDMHLDTGASYFFTPQFHAGLVGYAYRQITDDTGSGARFGGFQSQVFGVGPQLGYMFTAGEKTQGYINLKGYKEFEAKHRPEGWNLWLTVSFTFGGA